MQVSVESKEGLERRMTVELPAEQVNQAVEKRLKEVAKTARLDGFRPGKVPLSVIRKRYAPQVTQEVFGDLVQSSYFEALAQEKLQPAGEPTIEPLQKDDGDGMGYTAVFEVMPEVSINDMKQITIQRPVAEVTDSDLKAMIEKLRKQRTTWNDVEREAAVEDQVTISFKGTIDGEAFEGGSAENVPLVIGSNSMIEGFESGLVGSKVGDSLSLDLNFPEDYHAEALAGKPANFQVEVSKVAEPVLPDVDEAFAKAFGVEEGGVEGLHTEIRSNMERELEEKIGSLLKERAMDALLEANSLEVPKALITQESKALQQQTRQNLAQSGQSSNMELPLELFEDQAKKRVILGLLIGEVVQKNEIKVDADRVRSKVEQFAQSYENPQEVIDYYYSDKQHLAAVENVVLEDQVVDWVLEQVTVEETTSGFDDVMNPTVEKG